MTLHNLVSETTVVNIIVFTIQELNRLNRKYYKLIVFQILYQCSRQSKTSRASIRSVNLGWFLPSLKRPIKCSM